MTHLAKIQVDAYWGRRLAPADLLSLDFHLGECARCREALMAAAPPAHFAMLEDPQGHLEYEQIEAYLKETASGETRAGVESHTAGCESCRTELEDLRAFRVENALKPNRTPRKVRANPFQFRYRWWAAAVAAAACLAAVVVQVGLGRGVLLHDSGQSVRLDRHGKISGLANLPDAESSVLAAVLTGGDFPKAPRRPELAPAGAAPQTAEFAMTDPLCRVVLEDRPIFRWTILAGASSYRVRILEADSRVAAESPRLSETDWQPENPLARDHAYSWEVAAMRGGDEVHAPQSEARFVVLDQARADRLNAALARTPVSHLALAALYAEAGMDKESLQELQTLETENPGSALLARLGAAIASRMEVRP